MLKMSQTAASVNDVRINQKNLKNIFTVYMKFSILNKMLFEAANISKML